MVFSAEEIRAATERVAREINADYRGKDIHLLGVLKGCFLFLADLVRHLQVPCTVDFVRLSSYGGGTRSSGTVRQLLPPTDSLAGRHVILVEEIVDSGVTLAELIRSVEEEEPASVRICTLVDKTGRREVEVPVDYRGLVLQEGFLVGYGLDLGEKYRNLPAIYRLDDP